MRAVCIVPGLLLLACSKVPGPPPKQESPAKVEGAIAETALALVAVTAAAVQRLGITVVPVQERLVVRRRTLGGAAAVPSGRTRRLVAPFAARLGPVSGAGTPVAGASVTEGQTLFVLQPLQPETVLQQASAQRDLAAAQALFDAAATRHRRAEQMLRDKTGSVRGVEEASAVMATASADLAGARARMEAWSGLQFGDDGSLALQAPLASVVIECEVGLGDVVTAGTLLCELAALDPLWIRVPVHAGELARVDAMATARIHRLSDPADAAWLEARVAGAPPAADAATGSVDLVYELANPAVLLRPGERVLATLQLRDEAKHLVVPRTSILLDVNGGSWVYVRKSPQTFTRSRVQVAWVDGADAVLSAGPPAGTDVVTLGAAELFGTEFGQGK